MGHRQHKCNMKENSLGRDVNKTSQPKPDAGLLQKGSLAEMSRTGGKKYLDTTQTNY